MWKLSIKFDRQSLTLVGSPELCHLSLFASEFHESPCWRSHCYWTLGSWSQGLIVSQVIVVLSILGTKKNFQLKGLVGQYAPILCSSVDCYHAPLAEGPEKNGKIWSHNDLFASHQHLLVALVAGCGRTPTGLLRLWSAKSVWPTIGWFLRAVPGAKSGITGELSGKFWDDDG